MFEEVTKRQEDGHLLAFEADETVSLLTYVSPWFPLMIPQEVGGVVPEASGELRTSLALQLGSLPNEASFSASSCEVWEVK